MTWNSQAFLKVADEHEAGHSVFTDSCRLSDERTTGAGYKGVSMN